MALATQGDFRPFPKFPLELKEMIWKCTLASSRRIITIKSDKTEKGVEVVQSTPVLLQTNRHARSVALKTYTLFFADQPTLGPFYFNFGTDTIYAEGFGTLRILMKFPFKICGGERHFIQGELQGLMVIGHVGNPGGAEFNLLQDFTALKRVKLETQGAALESGPDADMGGSWHSILARRLRKENKDLVVQWGKRSGIEKEAARKSD